MANLSPLDTRKHGTQGLSVLSVLSASQELGLWKGSPLDWADWANDDDDVEDRTGRAEPQTWSQLSYRPHMTPPPGHPPALALTRLNHALASTTFRAKRKKELAKV